MVDQMLWLALIHFLQAALHQFLHLALGHGGDF